MSLELWTASGAILTWDALKLKSRESSVQLQGSRQKRARFVLIWGI